MNTNLFANPALFNAYQSDPKLAMAQGLMQQGASTAPVRSPLEGLARALTGGLGGLQASQVRKGYQGEDASYRQALAQALQSDDPVAALANSQDPTLQTRGLEEELALGQTRAKAKIDLQNQLYAKGLMQNPDGSVSPVPQYGAAMGGIANDQALATIPSDVAKQQALIPGKVQEQQALIPGDVSKAAQTAEATLPTEVRKAYLTAQATAPIEVQKNVNTYNATQAPQNRTNNREKLADDYRQDPNVKNYQTVAPILASMQDAAKVNNRAADLNLVYGMAKIFDPGSVVREGEQVLVTNTQSLPADLVGMINKLNGGERLQPEARAALLGQAQSRVGELKKIYDQAQAYYGNQAQKIGLQPNDVFYNIPTPAGGPNTLDFDAQGNPVNP